MTQFKITGWYCDTLIGFTSRGRVRGSFGRPCVSVQFGLFILPYNSPEASHAGQAGKETRSRAAIQSRLGSACPLPCGARPGSLKYFSWLSPSPQPSADFARASGPARSISAARLQTVRTAARNCPSSGTLFSMRSDFHAQHHRQNPYGCIRTIVRTMHSTSVDSSAMCCLS